MTGDGSICDLAQHGNTHDKAELAREMQKKHSMRNKMPDDPPQVAGALALVQAVQHADQRIDTHIRIYLRPHTPARQAAQHRVRNARLLCNFGLGPKLLQRNTCVDETGNNTWAPQRRERQRILRKSTLP
eukprot:1886530-Pyramimonas_sp.AAC.1